MLLHRTSSIAVAVALLAAAPGIASSTTAGSIIAPTITSANILYFQQGGTRTTTPSCATDPRWVVDPSTAGAQSLISMINAAFEQGRNVIVSGNGFCLSGTNNETVAYVGLQ